ncbi:NTP transferase domain-containing protein [Nitratireductor pacificus]|uniref:Molybdopterin molybdochelatase / molybdenum cofactor cytidylyltransferase n=1 Tax=Nitratireductor pacificus pht-3B TaxID=391937 RepID=K2N6B8_9HYPH|nr:molybdopterin-binding/glycosyltransferase family 2 protein [Nitratireductor pacificus]EKF19673.1 molybdopterin molybdochelatase / molybdenum cofactor cytidylyltransferase [Nitratireductor pacificus pht-3B]
MKFGPVSIDHAEGAVLAHATLAGDTRLRKAHRLTAGDIALLKAAGVETVTAARLDPGDLGEDEAAARLAASFVTPGIEARAPSTGRVNLYAANAGLFTVDRAMIDAFNGVDPAITIATLPPFTAVSAGQMVATVKIIPFAVAETRIAEAAETVAGRDAFSVRPFAARRVGVVQTVLPSLKPSVLDKTARITAERLARSGSAPGRELRPEHDEKAVAAAIGALVEESDLLLVFGASAVCDADDVIPAAIRRAGGRVERVGMPVDPGNLLVIGEIGGKPVLGAPGCARSPKTNGFDWVLDRLMAGLSVTGSDIAGMGVGGLLAEIPTRPQPREPARQARALPVWGVLLAAGQSRRMGAGNKLLADFDGTPLVRRTASALARSEADGAVAVLGHQADRVRMALDGLGLAEAVNPAYAEGLSGSLRAGIAALPDDAAGALIVLADMPGITAGDLDLLIEAFRAAGGNSVVRASHNGKRGNPVLLPRALFAEIGRLRGDTGARHVVEQGLFAVIDVEVGAAAHLDVDTPEALEEAGGVLIQ